MSNFDKALDVCLSLENDDGDAPDSLDCVRALRQAGLLMPDVQIIRTPEELEALAREDADAVVLASEAGAARSVKALCGMHQLVPMWGLPAVVIATGDQVRAAREAMEQEHE